MADRYPYQAEAVGARDNRGGARAAESDPLAELARLIGQSEQNAYPGRAGAAQPQRANYSDRHQQPQYEPQPYDQQQHYEQQYYDEHQAEPSTQEPAQPSWMRTAASSWQQPQQQAPAAHHAAPEQAHYQQEQEEYSDTPAFLRTARQHDPSRYDGVLYDQNSQNMAQPQYADGQYADGQYQDGYQDQADPNGYPPFYGDAAEEEPRRKRGGLMTVVAVLALAVVGTAGAYGYRSYTGGVRSGEPPVIKAEPGANKIVPPTQTSDASGKIVDRIGGSASGQERVLSREEQPIDINGRNAPRVVFPPTNANPNPPTLAATTQQALPLQAAANGALGDEPRRVRTVPVRPDQPDVVPQQSNQPRPPPTQARAQAPAAGNGPISLAPGATPVRTQTAAAPAPSRGSGGYMVQISSQRSEADAQASYQAMQSKFPSVLGSHQASIRRADLGEKGIYYRALVGPFAAAEDAGQLCNNLKSAGGQCVVQRN